MSDENQSNGKITVDFSRKITDKDDEPVRIPKRNDDDGQIVEDDEGGNELTELEIGDELTQFLEQAKTLVDSRSEGSGLQKICGDIETRETEYTERSIELILKYFDEVLENISSSGKRPVVMDNLFEFLDDLEEKISEEEDDA